MARFDGGYIKIHRKAIFGDIGQNPFLFSIWVWLLAVANYKATKARFQGEQVTVERGQLLTSAKEISEQFGVSRSTVLRHLDYLRKTNRIEARSTHQGTLVTILNYESYQGIDSLLGITDDSPMDHERYNERITSDILSEEVKKERKKELVSAVVERQKPSTTGAVEELRGDDFVEDSLRSVSQTAQRVWLKAYPDAEWIKSEILKAIAWLEVNPKRRPKSFARFMANWLSSGWEKYRKTIPTNPAPGIPIRQPKTQDEIEFDRMMAEQAAELERRHQA